MKKNSAFLTLLAALALTSCFSHPSSSMESSSSESTFLSPAEDSGGEAEEKVPLLGIKVKQPGPTQFFKGDTFSADGLVVEAMYANGKIKTLDNNRLVFSGINLNKTGMQTLTLSYDRFSASYQIIVYEATDIEIRAGGFNKTVTQRGDSSSSYQTPFGLVYQGQALDASSISIHLTYEQDGARVEGSIPITDRRVRLSNFSSVSLGQQKATITVNAGEKVAASVFPYSVTNALPYVNRGASGRFIECRVDSAYEGMEGALQGGTHEDGGRGYSHLFRSISNALTFIKTNNLDKRINRRIYVASGEYNEKIDVTEPYVSLIGEGGEAKILSLETISSRPGLENPEETYVLAVREEAFGFQMENLSVINKAADLSDKPSSLPAVSFLCQADHVRVSNSTFSGVDGAIRLNHGRRYFQNCHFYGRDKMVSGNSAADKFEGCDFTVIPNRGEAPYCLVGFDGAGRGGLSEALNLSAQFLNCSWNEVENAGNYVISTIDSPYTRILFQGCSFPSFLGNSRDTLFPSGAYSNRLASLLLASDAPIHDSGDLDQPISQDIFSKSNGMVNFPDTWDGSAESIYEVNPHLYLTFDGFSYRNDAEQTVLSPELDLPASAEETKINDILSLYPVNGIRFDMAKRMTYFAEGSYLTLLAPVGSRVEIYSEIKEGSRYANKGFAKIDGDAIHQTLYIYKSPATFYVNGSLGENQLVTFKAMGNSYLKFIVITPNALGSDQLENPTASYSSTPTSMYVRNYQDGVYNESYYTPSTIFTPFRDNILLEYDADGFASHIESGYNQHVHVTLCAYLDGKTYDQLDLFNSKDDWYMTPLTGGAGGDICGDVLQQYYGRTGNGVDFYSGEKTFQSIWLAYLFNASNDSKVDMSQGEGRLVWRRFLWISYSAPRQYAATQAGYYDFSAANLWDDASDHELILENSIASAGYTLSTGESRVCAYDASNGGLRLEGQIEYRWRLHSSLLGGDKKLVVKAKKGSSVNIRSMEEEPIALAPASYSTPDYDYFEYLIPEGSGETLALIPGEAGATLYGFNLGV